MLFIRILEVELVHGRGGHESEFGDRNPPPKDYSLRDFHVFELRSLVHIEYLDHCLSIGFSFGPKSDDILLRMHQSRVCLVWLARDELLSLKVENDKLLLARRCSILHADVPV